MATQVGGPFQVMPENNADNTNRIDLLKVGSDHTNPTVNFRISGADNAAATYIPTLTNASMGQATTFTLPDPGRSSAVIPVSPSTLVATAPNAVIKVITCTAAALASAGKVNVIVHPSATAQFAILDVKVIYSAAGLSGGGGDRLLKLQDGTIAFNNAGITAAVLGTPVNTVWGGTGNPLPGSVDPTASTAGADIYFQYSGGTADFTTGSVKIMVTYAQVTA